MTDMPTDLLREALAQHHMRLTTPRSLVFDLLFAGRPLTIAAIIGILGTRVDRASVYRTIALFEEIGIVDRVHVGWKYTLELSDVFVHHHHHLTCTRCGIVVSITENDDIERLLAATAQAHGFSLEKHQLEIQGLCQACQANNNP